MTRPLSAHQRGLQHFNGSLFVPNSVDGGGNGLGGIWTPAGTVTHATPSTDLDIQMKRTIYSNAAGANNEAGVRQTAAGDFQYWFGNAALLGGFYFSCIFRIETWSADSGRLFIGLSKSATAQVTTDTVQDDTCGLWHAGTDGQDVLWFMTRDNATTNTTAAATHALNPGILASGTAFMFEMWATPFGLSVTNTNFRLSYFDLTHSASAFKPAIRRVKWNTLGGNRNSIFMAPQVGIGNGGTDVTADHFQLGIMNIYCVPHSGEQDVG